MEKDRSISHLKDALRINPKFTVADRLISSMKKYDENDDHLNDMKSKTKELDLSDERKSDLYFALGKAYEDLKKYDQSFSYYQNGNKLLRKRFLFDLKKEKNNFLNIKKFFKKKTITDTNQNQRKLIFIVGMPRSGHL